MASFRLLMFFFAATSMGWSPTNAEDSLAQSGAVSGTIRERRHLIKKKLCKKYGLCNNGGFQGGYQGLQGGHQGLQGGHQGGYPGQYQPPINIAISQSQSSANGAGGGYSNGHYPNNYQYNGGYPNQGHYGGFPQGNYGVSPHQGGHGPGFGNGQGAYNNQFNGNFYGPGGSNGGGYGFQKPFGPYYDENPEEADQSEHEQDGTSSGSGAYNEYSQGPVYNQGHGYNQDQGYNQGQGYNQDQDYAVAGAFAIAGRKNN